MGPKAQEPQRGHKEKGEQNRSAHSKLMTSTYAMKWQDFSNYLKLAYKNFPDIRVASSFKKISNMLERNMEKGKEKNWEKIGRAVSSFRN